MDQAAFLRPHGIRWHCVTAMQQGRGYGSVVGISSAAHAEWDARCRGIFIQSAVSCEGGPKERWWSGDQAAEKQAPPE